MNWDSWYVSRCKHPLAERFGDGDYCVYLWEETESGDVFYVGSGRGYRFNSVNPKARSPKFMWRFNRCPCQPRIVFYGMTKEESLFYEKKLIIGMLMNGFDLVNMKIPKEYTPEWAQFM